MHAVFSIENQRRKVNAYACMQGVTKLDFTSAACMSWEIKIERLCICMQSTLIVLESTYDPFTC
jgi:hypothetical protein